MTSPPSPLAVKLSYTVDQAAQAIGVSRRTIYNLLSNCELASTKVGGRRLIRANDLQALLA